MLIPTMPALLAFIPFADAPNPKFCPHHHCGTDSWATAAVVFIVVVLVLIVLVGLLGLRTLRRRRRRRAG